MDQNESITSHLEIFAVGLLLTSPLKQILKVIFCLLVLKISLSVFLS